MLKWWRWAGMEKEENAAGQKPEQEYYNILLPNILVITNSDCRFSLHESV